MGEKCGWERKINEARIDGGKERKNQKTTRRNSQEGATRQQALGKEGWCSSGLELRSSGFEVRGFL